MVFTEHVLYVKCLIYFTLNLTPKGWYPDPHAPNEETETQRGQVVCPRPHREEGVELRLNQIYCGTPRGVPPPHPTISQVGAVYKAGYLGVYSLFL